MIPSSMPRPVAPQQSFLNHDGVLRGMSQSHGLVCCIMTCSTCMGKAPCIATIQGTEPLSMS